MRTGRQAQPRGDATRQAILDVAEREFADRGFDAARLEDIGAAAGIRRPSLLYYFPTKRALYDAVEESIFAGMHAETEARIGGTAEPVARLLAHLDGWLDFLVARPSAARIIQRLVADSSVRAGNPVQFSNLVLVDMERTIEAGISAGAFAPIAPIQFINAVAGGILFYVCNGSQVGIERRYDAADARSLHEFRDLLHRLAITAIAPATASALAA